jgi:hypothetical protein
VKLVALLSFFDEEIAPLERLIASLPLAGVTHLIALDGRYEMFPAPYNTSPREQVDAINAACKRVGIECMAFSALPPLAQWAPWHSEMEKRSYLFRLGELVATTDDWYLIVDADEEIISAPPDLHQQLATTTFDVASVTLDQAKPLHGFPKFFRAIRGLHVTGNHYTYATPDGRYLWGNALTTRLQPRLPLDMVIRHHEHERTMARRTAKVGYYAMRDNAGVEAR